MHSTITSSLPLKILFKSLLPFFLGTMIHSLKRAFLKPQNPAPISHYPEVLDQIGKTCFTAYDSCLHFLIAMLLINLIIKAVIILKELTTRSSLVKTQNPDKSIFDKEDLICQGLLAENKSKGKSINIMRIWLLASLYYSCAYGLFSIIGIDTGLMGSLLKLPQETLNNNNAHFHENLIEGSRILFEEPKLLSDQIILREDDRSAITKEKISLSLGKLLGTLEMEACSLTISKDNKVAFAVICYYQTLKVIDISDVQFPKIIASYAPALAERIFRTVSLLLSNDEKMLFIYNFESVRIINVTNPASPTHIMFIQNTNYPVFEEDYQESSFKFPEYFPAPMALSKDEKVLFLGGVGLQAYSIESLRSPELIFSIPVNMFNDQFVLNTLTLSSDRKSLFLVNGTLDIYNITDPKNLSLITSFATESKPSSIILSKNNQRAYITGTSAQNQAIIEEVDITNLQSIRKVHSGGLSEGNNWRYPSIIAQSPEGSQLYILLNSGSSDFNLVVFDTLQQKPRDTAQSIVQKPYALVFSANSKQVFAVSKRQFSIMELCIDYPNRRIFSLLNNSVEDLGVNKPWRITLVSNDNKLLFAAYNDTTSSVLEIWNITDRASPFLVNSFSLFAPVLEMQLSGNTTTKAYICDTKSLFILDLSDLKHPRRLSTIKEFGNGSPILPFIISSDDRHVFFVFGSEMQLILTAFDIETGREIQTFVVEEFMRMRPNLCKLLISNDNKFLFVLVRNSYIYRINPSSGHLKAVSFFALARENIEMDIYSATMSHDNKALFIETYNHIRFRKLVIVNVTNITAPKIISEMSLPSIMDEGVTFPLYLNQQTAYIFQDLSLLKIDLTNLTSPKLLGLIPLYIGKGEEISSVVLTKDGLTGYVSTVSSRVHILTLQVNYTVLINQENFSLGKKYSDHVNLLKISEDGGEYQPVIQGTVKFLRFFLVDFKNEADKVAVEMSFFAAPYWMNFDKENYILTIDPKKQSDLGTYTMYFAFSKKIPLNAFNGVIESIDSPEKSHDLMALLISMGYVDNQRFLTSSFGYFEDFIVPSNWTSQRQQIYDILRKYYIDTCNQFDIVSSLDVLYSNGKKLEITSASLNTLKVDITLLGNSTVKFLNKPYASLQPVIIDKKSRLLIEGPLKEINQALKDIVINMEQDNMTCNGQVSVIDGLNYPVTRSIENIQDYFKKNGAPRLKINVQEQINAQALVRPILTGNYFTMVLNEKTFEDENSESLSYELILQGKNASLPNWITIHGLEIQGTPPEEIFGRDISLSLVASNEFKRVEEVFTLHINLSSGFIGKLLLRYSPYILTILTLWINANRIYNILCKRRYRHVKDINLLAGEKVDASVVFPIYFIAEESKESQFLLKQLKARDLDEATLDKSEIIREIKEIVKQMNHKDKEEKLSLYTSKSSLKKQLINQLILNEIVMKGQLELKSEKLTKSVFESLKDQWINVVEWDSLTSYFIVNEEKLKTLLGKEAIQLISTTPHSTQVKLETSLLSENEESVSGLGINLNLLKDAIVAHVFNLHSLKKLAIRSDVVIKQKVRANWLLRFFKLDLKDIYLNEKSKIDYGINYKIKEDILFFYGEVDKSLVGKTLAVQITDPRSRILKEIWMHGRLNDDCDSSSDDDYYSRDEKYEVF